MRSPIRKSSRKLVEYDAISRRLWIRGQRCHHGATGSLVAVVACAGLLAETAKAPIDPRAIVAIALTGGVLMAHDWKDRSIWFERGRGTQAYQL